MKPTCERLKRFFLGSQREPPHDLCTAYNAWAKASRNRCKWALNHKTTDEALKLGYRCLRDEEFKSEAALITPHPSRSRWDF
jgi:hypothetical protein